MDNVRKPISIPDNAEHITLYEAADILKLSLTTAYQWCKQGKMPGAFRLVDRPKNRWHINVDIFKSAYPYYFEVEGERPDSTLAFNEYEKAEITKMIT